MAEGGDNQRITIHNYFMSHGDGVNVRVDNIGQQTNVEEGEIGQVYQGETAASHPGAQGFIDEDAAEDEGDAYLVAADSSQPLIQHHHDVSSGIKLTDQHGDNHIAEEKADVLIKNSKCEEAVSLLEDLPPTKRQQTQLMECYFQLKRDSRLPKCIETMKTLMMRHPRPKPDDVYNLGETNSQNSPLISWSSIFHMFGSKPDKNFSRVKALTFFSCASKLYVLDSKPDDAVAGIGNCTFHCKNVIEALVGQGTRMRVLTIDIGIAIMNEMLVDIRSITHADPDKKAECESRCLKHLGVSYCTIKKPEKAIEIYKQGIEIMKRHFGSNASKYQVLGGLLDNMGWANYDLGNYREAEKFCLESLKVIELAQDYENEGKKKTDIDMTQSNLKLVRNEM